jgi:hypothetical protein
MRASSGVLLSEVFVPVTELVVVDDPVDLES